MWRNVTKRDEIGAKNVSTSLQDFRDNICLGFNRQVLVGHHVNGFDTYCWPNDLKHARASGAFRAKSEDYTAQVFEKPSRRSYSDG